MDGASFVEKVRATALSAQISNRYLLLCFFGAVIVRNAGVLTEAYFLYDAHNLLIYAIHIFTD